MKHYLKFTVGMLSVAAFLFVGMNTAFAGDKKVYPGSMAVKYSSGGTLTYSGSAVGNSSARSYAYVDLPVINDVMGRSISSSYVKVLDRSPRNHRCSINSVYWNETYDRWYGDWGDFIPSKGLGNNLQTLNTGSIDGSSARHEYFSCRIPPKNGSKISYIVQYSVTEG